MSKTTNKHPEIKITCKGSDTLPIDRILEFQGELKTLSSLNMEKLKKSILKYGFTVPFFVWEHEGDYLLLDGHQRLKTLLQMRVDGYNMPMFPVAYIEADNEKHAKEKLLHITSQYGEFNPSEVDKWINEFDDEITASLRLVDQELELALKSDNKETVGDDEYSDDVEPITKLGDLWLLGNHRLLCGDSTDVELVKKVSDGNLIDMFLSDPPYNVNYEGKTNKKLKIKNDKMENNTFRIFLRDAFYSVNEIMKSGAVFYIWHADSEGYNFRGACEDINWKVRQCLIWNKNSLVMGRSDYHWKHEPCLYGWKEGSAHLWATDSKQTTVLNFDRPSRSGDHPTMKPIDLLEYQVLNNTKGQDIVFDSFLGSGSTLITCEKTNRICYGLELDPHYCDVIVNRYKTWCEKNDKKPIVKLNGEVYEWVTQ